MYVISGANSWIQRSRKWVKMTGRMLSEASILFMRVEPSTLEGSAGHLCAFPSVNLLNCGNHDYMKTWYRVDTVWIGAYLQLPSLVAIHWASSLQWRLGTTPCQPMPMPVSWYLQVFQWKLGRYPWIFHRRGSLPNAQELQGEEPWLLSLLDFLSLRCDHPKRTPGTNTCSTNPKI